MKNKSISKVQILAVLALALSLGLVAPSVAVFADGGAQGSSEVTSVSTQSLLDVIDQATKIANYAKYKNLVNGYNGVAAATPAEGAVTSAVSAVKALVTDADLTNESSAADVKNYIASMTQYKTWNPVINAINEVMKKANVTDETKITAASLADCTPTQIATWYNAINNVVNPVPATYAENVVVLAGRVKNNAGFADYNNYEPLIAAAVAAQAKPGDTALKTALATQISNKLNVTGVNDLSVTALINVAKEKITATKYDQYVALYNSMKFIRDVLPTGTTTITAKLLNDKYNSDELAKYYGSMFEAAKVIDATAVNNLMPAELPNTGSDDKNGSGEGINGDDKNGEDEKPEAPNTGIVGLFESGALDLGTITLIVSVAVASVAGLGLIAKLYLKHKF